MYRGQNKPARPLSPKPIVDSGYRPTLNVSLHIQCCEESSETTYCIHKTDLDSRFICKCFLLNRYMEFVDAATIFPSRHHHTYHRSRFPDVLGLQHSCFCQGKGSRCFTRKDNPPKNDIFPGFNRIFDHELGNFKRYFWMDSKCR